MDERGKETADRIARHYCRPARVSNLPMRLVPPTAAAFPKEVFLCFFLLCAL